MNANVDLQSLLSTLSGRVQELESMISEMGIDLQTARKKRFPRKTQPVTLNGMTRALCVETIDPYKSNRVRFYHPLLHNLETPIKNLPFAKPISALGGFDDCGLSWVPPAGSTLCLLFENGNRDQPYYMGTTWHRDRGPDGNKLGFPVKEFYDVYQGHRNGYLVGKNDGSQVLPPWNTESSNGNDIDSVKEFELDPDAQRRITYPNIYGFKTPEKHMMKMVDGDAKCNRRFKRVEIMSGCGNWMMFKDDHLHYGGQWSHPDCGPEGGDVDITLCADQKGDSPYFTDPHGKPLEKGAGCGSGCNSKTGSVSCGEIVGGHPSTPGSGSKHYQSQKGANRYFKHQNECRPYKGPGTPQNNRCDLPQTGVQILSISGHTIVMDDSVEEPQGLPIWERSLDDFDFGCNDKYLGRFYIKSATGHSFTMNDAEKQTGLRSVENYVQLKSANGNRIELNDHTIGGSGCKTCPPNYAGEQRGIHLQSTSNHQINLVDHMNQQCSPCRKEGGVPVAKATQAYLQIQSGYGSEIRLSDDNSQQETQSQWIQITQPQCTNPETDANCNQERGPHFLRFQGRPKGQPGVVFLRAGGHAIRQTNDMDIVLVGDKEKNPADKFTYVSKMRISSVEDVDFRYTGELHVFFAEKYILLMAGRDCPPSEGNSCCGPCLYPVVVGKCPVTCPLTGIVHWTEKSLSERVFASGSNSGSCSGGSGGCPPGGAAQPCSESDSSDSSDIDTGAGTFTV